MSRAYMPRGGGGGALQVTSGGAWSRQGEGQRSIARAAHRSSMRALLLCGSRCTGSAAEAQQSAAACSKPRKDGNASMQTAQTALLVLTVNEVQNQHRRAQRNHATEAEREYVEFVRCSSFAGARARQRNFGVSASNLEAAAGGAGSAAGRSYSLE
jgi:hypothetical protein